MERAFASPETWVPLLAWPVTAAEQGLPFVWALITFRVIGEGLANNIVIGEELANSYSNANNKPGVVISTGDTGEQHRPDP